MSKLTEVLKLFCYDPETDGNLTFNVTEALTKNWEKIDAALAPLGGATTAQAALAALGAGVRPNLLDNAIFVGGGLNGKLPVNQRAKTEYSNGYGIDRWHSVYGNTMEILQDGVKFQYVDNNYVAWQVLSNQLSYGNTITVSALLTNGILLTASGTLSPELDDIGTPAYNEIAYIMRYPVTI